MKYESCLPYLSLVPSCSFTSENVPMSGLMAPLCPRISSSRYSILQLTANRRANSASFIFPYHSIPHFFSPSSEFCCPMEDPQAKRSLKVSSKASPLTTGTAFSISPSPPSNAPSSAIHGGHKTSSNPLSVVFPKKPPNRSRYQAIPI